MNAGRNPRENAAAENSGTFLASAGPVRRSDGGKLGRISQRRQALAAKGGGQRPGFTALVVRPQSSPWSAARQNSAANMRGSSPAPTNTGQIEFLGLTRALPAREQLCNFNSGHASSRRPRMGHVDSVVASMPNVSPVRKQPIASPSPKLPSGPSADIRSPAYRASVSKEANGRAVIRQ